MNFGARARVRLDAIRHNLEVIREQAPTARVMAVVKANAYGHGLLPVAKCLEGADCLAVARLTEAKALRDAGVDVPVALLGGVFSEDDLSIALDLDLQLVVHNEKQIEWLERHGSANAVVWLKVDTGMNRLGVQPGSAPGLIDRLAACVAVSEVRVMTHFANADDVEDDTTERQLQSLAEATDRFDGDKSVANSPGIFGWQNVLGEFTESRHGGKLWIRPGLSVYGISPFANRRGKDLGLEPAMNFESQLIAVKPIAAGERVGYGGTWRAECDSTIGVIAAGYGDGYSRHIPAGSPVIVNDRRVPLAGRVSMDLTTVDLGPDADDKVGDRVLLWGDELPIEEIALLAQTIPYQLACGVAERVERIFSC